MIYSIRAQSQLMTAMENNQKIKKWGLASYLIAGTIWYYSSNFKATPLSEVIILVVAVSAGILFYRVREVLRFTNKKFIRNIIAAIIVLAVSMLLIGFLTSLIMIAEL